VQLALADGKKSWEGSIAMMAASFMASLPVLLFAQHMSLSRAILCAAGGAFVGAATELFSPSEYDTATVPVAVSAALLIMAGV
jgi:dolichol kinase